MTTTDDDFGIDIDGGADISGGIDDGDMDFGDDFDDGVTDDFGDDPVRTVAQKSNKGLIFKLVVLVVLLGGGAYFAMNILGMGSSEKHATAIDTTTVANLNGKNQATSQQPASQSIDDLLAEEEITATAFDHVSGASDVNNPRKSGNSDLASVGITSPDVSDLLVEESNDNVQMNGDGTGLPPPPSTEGAIEAKSVLEGFADAAENEKADLFDATSNTGDLSSDMALSDNTDVSGENDLGVFGETVTDNNTSTPSDNMMLGEDVNNTATELPAIDVTAEVKDSSAMMDDTQDLTTTTMAEDTVPVSGNAQLADIEKRLSDLEAMIADFQKMVVTQDDLAALKKNIGSLKDTVRAEKKSSSSVSAKISSKKKTVSTTSRPAAKAVSPRPAVKTWVLKSAKPGMAWVAPKGATGELKTVSVGDNVSGIGRVTSIAKDTRGKWAVTGTRGVINQ